MILVKASQDKGHHYFKVAVVGFNPITKRFLVADPETGGLRSYDHLANLDESAMTYCDFIKLKDSNKEEMMNSLVNIGINKFNLK